MTKHDEQLAREEERTEAAYDFVDRLVALYKKMDYLVIRL